MFTNTLREIFAVVVVASYVEGKGVDLALLVERSSVRRSLFKAYGARPCRSNNLFQLQWGARYIHHPMLNEGRDVAD